MSIYDFTVKAADGSMVPLKKFEGSVILFVNVASKCGFTPQYEELEEIYKTYAPRGLVILGFPCNQFGKQESGTDAEIQLFCKLQYNLSFPVMAKIDVNGENASPLYEFLKGEAPGIFGIKGVKWNFTKFLVNRRGKVLGRYAPMTKPNSLIQDIERELAQASVSV